MQISRRASLLGIAAGAAALTTVEGPCGTLARGELLPQSQSSSVERYLQQLARADGGYAWDDQPVSHLTPTFGVIGSAHLLGIQLPNRQRLIDFVREHHPARWKKLEQEHREFEQQQIQSLIWLGEDAHDFREIVAKWRQPVAYLKQYERDGYPVFRHQVVAFTARQLLGMPLADLDESLTDYIELRRRANGSFNNTPASDGGDGHVLNTLWGLQALAALEQLAPRRDETIEWLQSCQRPNGGFTWQPMPTMSAVSNVTYTWAAVRALALLDAQPKETSRATEFILQHGNSDGGFADRQDWLSNPLATYYALDALSKLDSSEKLQQIEIVERSATGKSIEKPSSDLKVYSIQIEAHGNGSPADAVRLAQSLRISMWGAKNAKPGWLERAQAIADAQRAPVKFFPANEEYGSWMRIEGLGTYSHMSDIIAPDPEAASGSLASNRAVSWPEFRQRRVKPLIQAQGRMVWQFGENEELVRLLLDDSLQSEGFAMISTFHFGNPDFTNTEPFLQHYRGQIPFVALQDAHGAEPWWFADMTSGFRTLFLAREPTWQSWLEALSKHWVVAVRNDEQSMGRLLLHAGSRAVSDFVLARSDQWQWWDNAAISRPMVSLVALHPDDPWEIGKPDRGINLRMRCAWSNTTQGQLKEPLAEMVSLVVDGKPVESKKQSVRGGRNPQLLGDQSYIWEMPEPAAGKHTAVATVRVLSGGRLESQSIEF